MLEEKGELEERLEKIKLHGNQPASVVAQARRLTLFDFRQTTFEIVGNYLTPSIPESISEREGEGHEFSALHYLEHDLTAAQVALAQCENQKEELEVGPVILCLANPFRTIALHFPFRPFARIECCGVMVHGVCVMPVR